MWDGIHPASEDRFDSSHRSSTMRWNDRLLAVVVVLLLWGFTLLAVSAVSPDARAMIAGEGMLYASSSP